MPLILLLDSNGQANKWAHWQDAVTYAAKDMIVWQTGEVSFTFHGGKSRMTGEVSTITTASIIAVKGVINGKRAHKAPALTNRVLFRRDKQICGYCGKHYHTDNLTRDHIVPVSKGGKDSWMNTVTACRGCNNYKEDKTLDQLDMKLLYVPYVPTRSEKMILENRKILVDQMSFLLASVPETSRAHDKDYLLS